MIAKRLLILLRYDKLINQTGYHNRFIGTFQETRKLIEKKSIGDIYHIQAESYGPVVLKTKENMLWRSNRSQGGGCLYDYASHVINLVDYFVGPIEQVKGTILKKIFQRM